MDCDSAAVVGRSAAVKTTVALCAFKWVCVPLGWIRNRLHIVMRVQQNRWRAWVYDARADHFESPRSAVRIRGLLNARVDTNLTQYPSHVLRGLLHMLAGNTLSRNRSKRNLLIQHGNYIIPSVLHASAHVFDSQTCHKSSQIKVAEQ